MRASLPDVIFRLATMPPIKCITCGKEMKLDHIRRLSCGYDQRSYLCASCEVMETFVFDITGDTKKAA